LKGWPQSWRRERFVDDFAGGRRQVPRCEARLKVSLRFEPSPTEENAQEEEAEAAAARTTEQAEIIAETINLSETGLAVSIASNRIGDRYLNVVGCTLQLTLELPAGTVRVRATPKWCQWSSDEGAARSFIIGLRIIEMSDEEWVLLVRYVHACL
jgi:hypothetical protein